MHACHTAAEGARIDALMRYEVLDTPAEEAFDRITRLVKTVLQMPMVAVSLVDRDRQWFKSRHGIAASQTPRDISMCTHTIRNTSSLIVPDTHVDPRFAASPLVTGEPFIRFYAGVPLRTKEGHNVGALCSMDTRVRELDPDRVGLLQDMARLVVDELELRLLATTDSLTGAMSRRHFFDMAKAGLDRARRRKEPASCLVVDIDHFKRINDAHGHAAGDVVLQRFAATCRAVLRRGDCFGRIGGEEFVVLLAETPLLTAFNVAERLLRAVSAAPIEAGGHAIAVTASIGIAESGGALRTLDRLIEAADQAMYEAKRGGRNRAVCHLQDDLQIVTASTVEN